MHRTVLFLLLFLPLPLCAATHLYVAPIGRDSNSGSADAPFATLARAAAAVTPGTIVHVAPGTYEGGIKTVTSGSDMPGGRIVFESTERGGAKIVPPADPAAATSASAWDNRGDYVDIAGFEIDGSRYQGGARWRIGIYNGGSHDTIRDNHVHHIATGNPCTSAGGAGIGVDSYYRGAGSDVSGNTVHDIGPAGCRFVHGIYISTPATVRGNIVYRVAEAGIHLWHDARNVLIVNNTVAASHTGIVVGGGDFYHFPGPNDHTCVFNNIVYDNKMGIVETGATGRHNAYRNNLVFQNRIANWRLQHGLAHRGTVAAPPAFIGYRRTGTPDFRLAAGSPAIGKGLSGMAGAGIDLGALQR